MQKRQPRRLSILRNSEAPRTVNAQALVRASKLSDNSSLSNTYIYGCVHELRKFGRAHIYAYKE